jgi:hypothetical protein
MTEWCSNVPISSVLVAGIALGWILRRRSQGGAGA